MNIVKVNDVQEFLDLFDDEGKLKEEPHTDGFGSLQERNVKRSATLKEIIMLILSFLLVLVCVLITVWMVYNLVTTGFAFPTDFIMTSSNNLIPKDFKGFKL